MSAWFYAFGVLLVLAAAAFVRLRGVEAGTPKRRDLVFQVSGVVLLFAVLVVSVGGLGYEVGEFRGPMNVVGAVLFVVSLAVRISAHVTIDRNYSWTLEIREGHRLVLEGLYRYVRHPIYSGTFLGVLAIPVYCSSLPGFALALLAFPVFGYRIGVEEEMLLEEFGDEYRRYMERTWRLIPYVY